MTMIFFFCFITNSVNRTCYMSICEMEMKESEDKNYCDDGDICVALIVIEIEIIIIISVHRPI